MEQNPFSLNYIMDTIFNSTSFYEASNKLEWPQKKLKSYLERRVVRYPGELWKTTAHRYFFDKKQPSLFRCPGENLTPSRPLCWVNTPTGEKVWDF